MPNGLTPTATPKTTSRKSAKRRITSDDESDNADSPLAGPSSTNPPSKKPRLSHVENFGAEDGTSRQPHMVTSKPGGSAAVNPKSNLKKRARIVSDDDDEFLPEPEVKPTMVASRPKTRHLKGKAEPSGWRASTVKGEAKLATSPSSGPTTKKRPREEENLEVDVTTVANPTTAKPSTSSVPAPGPDGPPPRKKLPTIKKKAKTDSTTTSSLASPALVPSSKSSANPSANPIKRNTGTGTPKPHSPAAVGLPKKLQGPVQATTTNPSGTGDFDLRDSNTWQSLMGKVKNVKWNGVFYANRMTGNIEFRTARGNREEVCSSSGFESSIPTSCCVPCTIG